MQRFLYRFPFLQGVVACCSYCSVLHRVAACCSVLQRVVSSEAANVSLEALLLQCVAACCSLLQCVAACCNMLQRVVFS